MTDLVLRNTPKIAEFIEFEDCAATNGCDYYEIFAREKSIVIAASSKIAKAMGYYRYLKEYCNVLITDGN